MSRLSSRPIRTDRLGNYCFFIDFEGHIADELTDDCLRGIQASCAEVKFLGSDGTAGEGSTQTRQEAERAWAEAEQWVDSLRAQIRPDLPKS